VNHHLTIRYIIAIPAEGFEEASPFRGFIPEMILITDVMRWVLKLPSHPLQYFMIRSAVIQQRIMGQGHWMASRGQSLLSTLG
jgi:hypothetical protein